MIKSYLKHTLLLVGCAMLFAACDSYTNDNWTPGEQVAEGVQGAFFSTTNATAFSVTDDPEFVIRLVRTDSTSAATVAINIVSRDTTAIEIPASATFEQGKERTDLVCRAEGLPANTSYSFTISIDDAQVSPYAAGASTFTGTITNASLWKTLVADATFYWQGSTALPSSWHGTIEQYMDDNHFRFPNFMGSGADWEFKIDSPEESLYYGSYCSTEGDVSTWMGSVNFEYDENHSYNYDGSWIYFMPDMANEVYGWTVPGFDIGYASFSVYNGYSYIDFSSKYFQTWAYGFGDDAAGTDISGYFYVTWK